MALANACAIKYDLADGPPGNFQGGMWHVQENRNRWCLRFGWRLAGQPGHGR
jgi:hypothetical protein